ncbi:pilus assembly protein [bacterium]|nr:pilus assembly protein [bacterium]
MVRKPYHVRYFNARGQGLAEYIIVTILVALIILAGIKLFGSSVGNKFKNASAELSTMKDADKTSTSAEREVRPGGGAEKIDVNTLDSGTAAGGGTDQAADPVAKLRPEGVGLSGQNFFPDTGLSWIGLVVIGVIAGLIAVAIVFRDQDGKDKKHKTTKRGKAAKKEAGQAMVEFVLISITFLFVLLGLIQLAMILNTQSLVRYAAFNAARSGIVHGGDLDKMREAARISLLAVFPKHGRADHRRGLMDNYLAARETDNDPSLTYANKAITEVKILNKQGLTTGQVVTFDDPIEQKKAILTIQVTHWYQLVIPLVNRMIFHLYNLFQSNSYQADNLDYYSAQTNKLRRSGSYQDIEYRIPLVSHYTMRLQSDYVHED